MAVPKRKVSKAASRDKRRNSHWKLFFAGMSKCPEVRRDEAGSTRKCGKALPAITTAVRLSPLRKRKAENRTKDGEGGNGFSIFFALDRTAWFRSGVMAGATGCVPGGNVPASAEKMQKGGRWMALKNCQCGHCGQSGGARGTAGGGDSAADRWDSDP